MLIYGRVRSRAYLINASGSRSSENCFRIADNTPHETKIESKPVATRELVRKFLHGISAMKGAHALSPGAKLTCDGDKYESSLHMQDSFAFVANIARLDGDDQVELVPGHVLRRATHDEIEIIKASLGGNKGGLLSLSFFPWEIRKRARRTIYRIAGNRMGVLCNCLQGLEYRRGYFGESVLYRSD